MRETHDGATALDDTSPMQAAPLPWRSSSRLAVEQLSFTTTDGALALAGEPFAPEAHAPVLVAESDPLLAIALREELYAQTSRHVFIATDGEQALDRITQTRPRVVLLDLELTGADVAIQLGTHPLRRDIHLIFVTAATSHDLFRLGVPDGLLLRKPYDPRDLAGIVCALLDA
jgi:CheY-like chemotaxis protein